MKEQWEFDDNKTCQVSGTGKYRFNQYGTDGFAYRQWRFKTKDAAMDYLARWTSVPVYRVKPDQPQYQVMVWVSGTLDDRQRKLRR